MGLQDVEQRVGAALELLATVVDAHEIAQPPRDGQRDVGEAGYVLAGVEVGVQGVAVADGDLLRGVGRDALRGVGQGLVHQALTGELVDEGLRVDDLGVDDHGQVLVVAEVVDQGGEVGVLHLLPDAVVAEQAAEDGEAGVKRVQAGGDLHGVGALGGLAVTEDDAALVQGRAAVGEGVLDDEVVAGLGVREAGEGRARGLDEVEVAPALGLEGVLGLGRGVRGDPVDHGPGEAHAALVANVVNEGLVNMAVLEPAVSNGEDGIAETRAVLREVVGRDHGDGRSTRVEAGKKERAHDAHGARGGLGAGLELGLDVAHELACGVAQAVALLGDGEGGELQVGGLEVALGAGKVLGTLGVREDAAGRRGDEVLVKGAVSVHDDLQDVVVVGGIDLVEREGTEGLGHDDAAGEQAFVCELVGDLGVEGAVEVAAAEVHPHGLLHAGGLHGARVVGGHGDACGDQVLLAVLPVLERERCHMLSLLFASLFSRGFGPLAIFLFQTGISLWAF